MTAAALTAGTLLNLTPHPIRVYDGERIIAEWPTSGTFARLDEIHHPAGTLTTSQGSIPLTSVAYAPRIIDLPPPEPGTVLVVSRVLAAASPRPDLVFPFDEVRDRDGQIIGCRGFARFTSTAQGDPDA